MSNSTSHEHTEDSIWVCPMHPEIRQDKSGDCPKCGMHLGPENDVGTDSCHHHHGHQHHDHTAAKGGRYDTVPEGYQGPVYTCPMHAEVRQTEPGSCPLCGMGLELQS